MVSRQLLLASCRFRGGLAEGPREWIFRNVAPTYPTGTVSARGLGEPFVADLLSTYGMTMTVLFRSLFIGYGEDKDLSPTVLTASRWFPCKPSFRKR